MYQIPIRNRTTGEEKNFSGRQEIANFLASREDAEHWTGWECLGALPAAEAGECGTYDVGAGVDASGEVHELAPDGVPPEMVKELSRKSPAKRVKRAVVNAVRSVLSTGK